MMNIPVYYVSRGYVYNIKRKNDDREMYEKKDVDEYLDRLFREAQIPSLRNVE